MIIRTGSLSIEVDKFDDAENKINDVVKKYSGFISNSKSTVNSSGNKSGTITVKVPADKYDALIAEVTKIGKVMSQNIQANDVTEEYVDLESRLKTQKELEQRLIKLLNEKASKLSDVIEVEEKLAAVRQKIESFEGKMKLLKSQSDLSTLTISVYEPSMISTSSGGGFFYELGQAVKKGLSGFTNVLAVSITFLIAIIPLAGFALIIFWIIRKIIRKRRVSK
jgi:chromosome segregation ATPase